MAQIISSSHLKCKSGLWGQGHFLAICEHDHANLARTRRSWLRRSGGRRDRRFRQGCRGIAEDNRLREQRGHQLGDHLHGRLQMRYYNVGTGIWLPKCSDLGHQIRNYAQTKLFVWDLLSQDFTKRLRKSRYAFWLIQGLTTPMIVPALSAQEPEKNQKLPFRAPAQEGGGLPRA